MWCLCGVDDVDVALNRRTKPSTGLVCLVRPSVLFNSPYPWGIVLAQLGVLVCLCGVVVLLQCVLIDIERDFFLYFV